MPRFIPRGSATPVDDLRKSGGERGHPSSCSANDRAQQNAVAPPLNAGDKCLASLFRPPRVPHTRSRLLFLEAVQSGQDLLAVLGGVYAGPHLDDLALWVDEKGVALGHLYTHVIAHGSVQRDDLLVLIA